MMIGLGPDPYRDHQIKSRARKKVSGDNENTCRQEEATRTPTIEEDCSTPPIDMVCRRLTYKWEPIFNIVHRYLFCRCVIRRSTPSRIEQEMTFLILADCPRHNVKDISHRDYGDIHYHEDPYFDQFGGYDSFRAIVALNPKAYESLGAEMFLPLSQCAAAFDAMEDALQKNNSLVSNYWYEVYERLDGLGYKLRDSTTKLVRERRLLEKGIDESEKYVVSEEERRDMRDWPLMRELDDILFGKWSGTPHWALQD
jgi:predicted DNA-binding protein